MNRYIFAVKGMHCGMCEARVNDLVRNAANVKKVRSDRFGGSTEVIAAETLDVEKITAAIRSGGYDVLLISVEPYEKKGFFARLKEKKEKL